MWAIHIASIQDAWCAGLHTQGFTLGYHMLAPFGANPQRCARLPYAFTLHRYFRLFGTNSSPRTASPSALAGVAPSEERGEIYGPCLGFPMNPNSMTSAPLLLP